MIRSLVLLVAVVMVYYALKTVVRSAMKAYREDEHRRARRSIGDEMVLDPECRTYVLKNRAVERNIRGTHTFFCSDACADRFAAKNRS